MKTHFLRTDDLIFTTLEHKIINKHTGMVDRVERLSYKPLTKADVRPGVVGYLTQDRVPDTDLFVVVEGQGLEESPIDEWRRHWYRPQWATRWNAHLDYSHYSLKVVFPRLRIIDGNIFLEQDKLNRSECYERGGPGIEDDSYTNQYREPFQARSEGNYIIYEIVFPSAWYTGWQHFNDEDINTLDRPIEYLDVYRDVENGIYTDSSV